MTFLGWILPGVRELRTPLAAGSLWVASLWIVLGDHLSGLGNEDVVQRAKDLIAAAPDGLVLAVGVVLVYYFGVLIVDLPRAVAEALMRQEGLRRLVLGAQGGRPTHLGVRVARPDSQTRQLIGQALNDRLSHVSHYVRDSLPTWVVLDEFELAALQLSHDAPEQYQAYDRLRAEAHLKAGVAAPLAIFCAAAGSQLPALYGLPTVAVGVVASCYLWLQGRTDMQGADQLLASALYFGTARVPLLDAMVETSKAARVSTDVDNPDVADLAWICDFLIDREKRDAARNFLAKTRHPSRGAAGVQLLQEAVPHMASKTVRVLFPNEDDQPVAEFTPEEIAEVERMLDEEPDPTLRRVLNHAKSLRGPEE